MTQNLEQQRRNEFVMDALDRFEQPLTRYAMRLLGGSNDSARDVVQHTFMQLCRQQPEEVGQKLAPWLYSVSRNRALDEIRRFKRKRFATDADFDSLATTDQSPEFTAEKNDLLKSIRDKFSCLNESQREIIELWASGLGTDDIGQVLQKKPVTVRVGLHRAIKRLKEQPNIKQWLERATGQITRTDANTSFGSASLCNGNPKPTIISEQS